MIPAERADTFNESSKFIVPAVPTVASRFFITIPVPSAVTPVSPDPSPINDVAVNLPLDALNLRFEPVFGA